MWLKRMMQFYRLSLGFETERTTAWHGKKAQLCNYGLELFPSSDIAFDPLHHRIVQIGISF